MICPGCLRDVPDLVGPGEDLCPDCFGIDADVLYSSEIQPSGIHAWGIHPWEEAEEGEDLDELDETDEAEEWWRGLADPACTASSTSDEAWEEEARILLERLDASDREGGPPTFRGRPRF